MKIKLIVFLSLLSINLYSQVVLTEYPLDNQLIGRDVITNSGTFNIAGEVYNSEIAYSSISIIVNREDYLHEYQTQNLSFDDSTAFFSF